MTNTSFKRHFLLWLASVAIGVLLLFLVTITSGISDEPVKAFFSCCSSEAIGINIHDKPLNSLIYRLKNTGILAVIGYSILFWLLYPAMKDKYNNNKEQEMK